MHTGISRAPRALKANLQLEKNKSTGERESEMDCDHTGGAQPIVNSVASRGSRLLLWRLRPARGSDHPLAPRRTVFVVRVRRCDLAWITHRRLLSTWPCGSDRRARWSHRPIYCEAFGIHIADGSVAFQTGGGRVELDVILAGTKTQDYIASLLIGSCISRCLPALIGGTNFGPGNCLAARVDDGADDVGGDCKGPGTCQQTAPSCQYKHGFFHFSSSADGTHPRHGTNFPNLWELSN